MNEIVVGISDSTMYIADALMVVNMVVTILALSTSRKNLLMYAALVWVLFSAALSALWLGSQLLYINLNVTLSENHHVSLLFAFIALAYGLFAINCATKPQPVEP